MKFNTISKLLVAAAVVCSFQTPTAHAGGDAGAAVAGGIIGIAAGAILGGIIASQNQPPPPPPYYGPGPAPYPGQDLLERAKEQAFSAPLNIPVTLGRPDRVLVTVTMINEFYNGNNYCRNYQANTMRFNRPLPTEYGGLCVNSRGQLYPFAQ